MGHVFGENGSIRFALDILFRHRARLSHSTHFDYAFTNSVQSRSISASEICLIGHGSEHCCLLALSTVLFFERLVLFSSGKRKGGGRGWIWLGDGTGDGMG